MKALRRMVICTGAAALILSLPVSVMAQEAAPEIEMTPEMQAEMAAWIDNFGTLIPF